MILGLWLGTALAGDLEQAWSRLGEVTALRATFEQTQRRAMFTKPLKSTGSVVLRRPDQVRWTVDSPTASVFVMNADALSMRYPSLDVSTQLSLKDRPDLLTLLQSLTVWMQPDLDQVRHRYTVKLAGPRIALTPKDATLAKWIARIDLVLADGGRHVRDVGIVEPDGDVVQIAFTDVELNPELSAGVFVLP